MAPQPLGRWLGTGGAPGRDTEPVSLSAAACRELTLRKGDIVYIHKEVDRNWLEGEHHGRVGIFPSNYVEVSAGGWRWGGRVRRSRWYSGGLRG